MRASKWIVPAVLAVGYAATVGGQTPATRPAAPSADDQMARLLAPQQPAGDRRLPGVTPGGPDRSGGAAAVAPGAPAVQLVREGTHRPPRTARLDHTSDGNTAVLTFDADGRAMRDPPMIVLPNLALEQMENVQKGQSRDTRFRVSGTITEYRGRNYILIDSATAVPDADASF